VTGGVGAVVLAAGSSSRLGRPKQVIRFRGESLLRRAARAALAGGCSPVVVVTGAYAELSKRELDGLDVGVAFNHRWQTGMASSIGVGLRALLTADINASAAVFLLCDQPHIDSDIVSRLTKAHRLTRGSVIASSYGDSFGAPALFSRSLFGELARLEGGAGAKRLIERHASDAHFIPFRGGEVDLDTPEDLASLSGLDWNRLRCGTTSRVPR
jgi:molybdenum cofactor cytidylyltransferase